MFWTKPQPENNGKSEKEVTHQYEMIIREIKKDHELALKEKEKNHELALKEKEFELRHFKDDEMKNLEKAVATKDQEIAVLKKENLMLEKITNLNADIIDIKDLVANLINKLPEIKLSNLTLNGDDTKRTN